MNWQGNRLDGSVGKSLLYGAQGGTFYIQGDADSRACIRLSGADVVIGGRLRGPIDDSQGNIAGRANLKGFAFEYMTLGRAIVLGDPGPWSGSGMTGGTGLHQGSSPSWAWTWRRWIGARPRARWSRSSTASTPPTWTT